MQFDLLFEAGVGLDHDSIANETLNKPYAYVGWMTHIHFSEHRGFAFGLRAEASSKLSDPMTLTAICRGTCTGSNDAPFDLAVVVTGGVVTW
jgi:hypothetical protein